MIFDSFVSPVNSSNPSFDDENLRLATFAGKSFPGNLALKSVHIIDRYLSVFELLSKSLVSSITEGGEKVFIDTVTPLLSPDGVNIEES